ncbi:hypothetical protein M9458_010838, partial [Cirrhinus mrigala]
RDTRSGQRHWNPAPLQETESGPQLCDGHTPAMRAWLIHKSCLSVLNAQTHGTAI